MEERLRELLRSTEKSMNDFGLVGFARREIVLEAMRRAYLMGRDDANLDATVNE
jgi:hypothetical protein